MLTTLLNYDNIKIHQVGVFLRLLLKIRRDLWQRKLKQKERK